MSSPPPPSRTDGPLQTTSTLLKQGIIADLQFRTGANGTASLVALSWDGVISGNTEEERALNRLQIWDLKTGRVADTARGLGTTKGMDVAAGPDRIAMVNMDGEVMLCALSTFEPRWEITVEDANSVAITADGKRVLVGDDKGTLRMLDGDTGKLRWKKKVLDDYVADLAFSSGGRYFAVGGDTRFVYVFDTRTAAVVARLAHVAPTRDRYGGIFALAFAPDEKTIATAGSDGVVRVFSLPSGRARREWKAESIAVAWAPDSATLAFADSTTLNFADVTRGSVVTVPTEHTLKIQALAYSPDGAWFASGSRDRTIRFWKTNTSTNAGSTGEAK